MAKRLTEQQTHSWAVYQIKGTPAKLLSIVDAGELARSADGPAPG